MVHFLIHFHLFTFSLKNYISDINIIMILLAPLIKQKKIKVAQNFKCVSEAKSKVK